MTLTEKIKRRFLITTGAYIGMGMAFDTVSTALIIYIWKTDIKIFLGEL